MHFDLVSRRGLGFWLLFAVTMAVYGTMIAWSLPRVSAAADGALPFDLRPGGYSFEETQVFLSALTPEGTAFYLDVQLRLDLFYPVLLGATLFFAIFLLARRRWGKWSLILALTAIPPILFDYAENGAIANMLRLGADGITVEIVAAASRWTVLKSQTTALAGLILFALLIMWVGKKIGGRGRRT